IYQVYLLFLKINAFIVTMTFKSYTFFLSSLCFISFLTFSACKSNKEDASKGRNRAKDLRAEVYVVTPQVFQNDINASGSLLPNEAIEIHPEVSGRITDILFKEGAFVKKG